ncbi:hypothetical protein [Trinickia terrae]|uniref:hypothetical protein n=1 Tax=Trinickia terrae TaxID=2571161 RepID=UPI00146A5AF9|nr:hypothetical protein [Trinickia terrae]
MSTEHANAPALCEKTDSAAKQRAMIAKVQYPRPAGNWCKSGFFLDVDFQLRLKAK